MGYEKQIIGEDNIKVKITLHIQRQAWVKLYCNYSIVILKKKPI